MTKTKTKKLYTLTDEHRAQLKPWADKWIKNALRTEPQTAEDKERLREAIRGLYRAANLELPERELFCAGPLTAAIAAPIASGAWWLRNNSLKQYELFGRVLSETELMASVAAAADYAARVLVASTRGLPIPEFTRGARHVFAAFDATAAAVRKTTDVDEGAITREVTPHTNADVRAGIHEVINNATREALHIAVNDEAIRAATGAVTNAVTEDTRATARDLATRAAVGGITRVATAEAADGATSEVTKVAIDMITEAASRAGAATSAARATTSEATREAVDRATADETTRMDIYAATYKVVDAVTRVIIRATRATIHAAINAAVEAATNGPTCAATDAIAHMATNEAIDVPTDMTVDKVTRAATTVVEMSTRTVIVEAVDAAVEAAIDEAVRAVTSIPTETTGEATARAATNGAIDEAIDEAVNAATKTAANTDAANVTSVATRGVIDEGAYLDIYAATLGSADTYMFTRAAIDKATNDEVIGANTREAISTSTSMTRNAVVDATARAVETDDVVRFLIQCCQYWYKFHDGGNQYSGWNSYLSFFRHIAKLSLPEYEKYQHYEAAAICGGPRFMHEEFWIAADFPEISLRDTENRPHCETGPFTKWRDGIALYAWHGTTVPAAWIEDRKSLDPKTALTWPNVEQRRAAAEMIGWDKVLEHLKPTVIDVHPNPMVGTLLRVDLPDSPGEQFLKVLCGTGRTFAMCVPKECKTALEAQTAMWPGLSEDEVLEALTAGRRA